MLNSDKSSISISLLFVPENFFTMARAPPYFGLRGTKLNVAIAFVAGVDLL